MHAVDSHSLYCLNVGSDIVNDTFRTKLICAAAMSKVNAKFGHNSWIDIFCKHGVNSRSLPPTPLVDSNCVRQHLGWCIPHACRNCQ